MKCFVTKAFAHNITEESFHRGEPGGRSQGEVHVKSRVFFEPLLDHRMLACRIVVADLMQGHASQCFAVDLAQTVPSIRHAGTINAY